jgi:hypothetical protein
MCPIETDPSCLSLVFGITVVKKLILPSLDTSANHLQHLQAEL